MANRADKGLIVCPVTNKEEDGSSQFDKDYFIFIFMYYVVLLGFCDHDLLS